MDTPKAGDICQNCRPRWAKQKKLGKRLVVLPIDTGKKDAEIAVCPYCDGPVADLLKLATERKQDSEATTDE